MSFPRVSIIILNWNNWRDTIECLESVYKLDYPNYDVIIVDNGSTDESLHKIKEYAEGKIKVQSKFFKYNPNNKPIKVFEIEEENWKKGQINLGDYNECPLNRRMILIKNKENYGYAGGNNRGIDFALTILHPDYIYILNNDVVIENNNLKELIYVFKIRNDAAVVAPLQMSYFSPEKVISAGAKVVFYKLKTINITSVDPSSEVIEVPFASGAALLFRAEVFYKVGFFNECLFLYWEETELLQRIKQQNFKIYLTTKTRIWHKVGATSRKINLTSLYFDTRNSILFFKKYANGTDKLKSLLTFQIILKTIRIILSSIIKYKDLTRIKVFFQALYDSIIREVCKL